MEVMHVFSNIDFHSPRPIWLQPPLSVQSAHSRYYHLVPDKAPFPRVIIQLSGGRLITLDYFHCRRGSILFLLE